MASSNIGLIWRRRGKTNFRFCFHFNLRRCSSRACTLLGLFLRFFYIEDLNSNSFFGDTSRSINKGKHPRAWFLLLISVKMKNIIWTYFCDFLCISYRVLNSWLRITSVNSALLSMGLYWGWLRTRCITCRHWLVHWTWEQQERLKGNGDKSVLDRPHLWRSHLRKPFTWGHFDLISKRLSVFVLMTLRNLFWFSCCLLFPFVAFLQDKIQDLEMEHWKTTPTVSTTPLDYMCMIISAHTDIVPTFAIPLMCWKLKPHSH